MVRTTTASDDSWSEESYQKACAETDGAVLYKPPIYKEACNKKQRQEEHRRRREMRRRLYEYKELHNPAVKTFMEDDLGNQPLAVRLCGNIIRNEQRHVRDFIHEFQQLKLREMQQRGRNPRDDRHYFGLVRSVVIGVQRMVAACRDEGEKEDALGLLMAMSLFHGSETPVRLFCGEAALTPATMQGLRNAMQTTGNHVDDASVPFGPLEWLAHLIRVEVKDYAAGATDVPITSPTTQVRSGGECASGRRMCLYLNIGD